MDSRKKACPNEQCKTYQKKKYNVKVNYCPECGKKLIYVCKAHGCFKPLDETQPKHEYCQECQAKRDDTKEQVKQLAKKVGGAGAAIIAIPFAKAIEGDAVKLAKNAGHKVVDVAINVVKKKA